MDWRGGEAPRHRLPWRAQGNKPYTEPDISAWRVLLSLIHSVQMSCSLQVEPCIHHGQEGDFITLSVVEMPREARVAGCTVKNG